MACVSREKFERLPEFAKPSRYSLLITPDLQKFTFSGEAVIDVTITATTDHLKLHAQDLDVSQASVVLEDGTELCSLPISLDTKWTMLTVHFPHRFSPQQVTLKFIYTGEINDKMRGFYRSSYKAADGSNKFIASTHFEPTYARLAFPCWDEPIYKARFDVSLVVDQHLTALANMNAVSEKAVADGKKAVTFATTLLISTYIIAFASATSSGTVTRVYTVPGKKDQGSFALELATKAIDWFNDWFGIPYPLPKCDLIAIPEFCIGAMENWGLVTFREVTLLVDSAHSSHRQMSFVALIVAHELSHFWFGDLVTMEWWSDLWLKEGFASFMAYVFVGYNYHEFKIWQLFMSDELARGFDLDALRSSHPIEVAIENPNEMNEIFDAITYSKADAMIRMICFYLGESTFQKGLQMYLQKYKYGNAVTVDLWNALGEASGQDVTSMMCGWTQQTGFPVVSVNERREGDRRILRMTQKRFIAGGGEDADQPLWQVPITISLGSDPSVVHSKVLLTEREQEFTIDGVNEGDWVKLNAGATGFFRVEYSKDMFNALLPDFKSRRMPVNDRFAFTSDLFAMVVSGRAPASQFLSLLSACREENEYVVWAGVQSGLAAIGNVLDHDAALKSRLDAFVCSVVEPVAARLGWMGGKGEDPQLPLLRSLIHDLLSRAGHQATIDEAKQMFDMQQTIQSDLRMTIYSSAIRHGGVTEFEKLIDVYETCGFGEVERQCLWAVSQSPSPALLSRFFSYGIEEGRVRLQDVMHMFIHVADSREGKAFVWPYFKANLHLLLEKFGGANSRLFQSCFKKAAEHACTEEVATEVESFVCSHVDASAVATLERPLRQVLESIRINARLLERNEDDVAQFLASNGF